MSTVESKNMKNNEFRYLLRLQRILRETLTRATVRAFQHENKLASTWLHTHYTPTTT